METIIKNLPQPSGSKIRRCRKDDNCLICQERIKYGEFYFNRNYHKELCIVNEKYHICCANKLKLTIEEYKLLDNSNKLIETDFNQSEKDLKHQIMNNLKILERNNKLSYIRILTAQLEINGKYCWVGKEGCSDLIIFFPNGKTFFLEIKKPSINSLQESQENFKKRINLLGFEFCLINNIIDYHVLINKYII